MVTYVAGSRKLFIKAKISGENDELESFAQKESQRGGFFTRWGADAVVDLDFSLRFPGDPIVIGECSRSIVKNDKSITCRFFTTSSVNVEYLRETFSKYPGLDFDFRAFAQSELIVECSCQKGNFNECNHVAERYEKFDETVKSIPEPEFGTFIDSRDNQTYKTVKIGKDEWLAENFRFKLDGEYQGLYNYEAACKAVPEGWHIPSQSEFEDLMQESNKLSNYSFGNRIGAALKSKDNWAKNGKAYDCFGFNALPTGYRDCDELEELCDEISTAIFWTASRNKRIDCYNDFFVENIGDIITYHLASDLDYFFPVSHGERCYYGLRLVKNRDLSDLEKNDQKRWDDAEKTIYDEHMYYTTEFEEGSYTDPRDGQTYKTIIYNDVEYLAENLRYKVPGSYSFDDDESKDAEYGRFYTWDSLEAATPEGWEVCSADDIDILCDSLFYDGYAGYQGAAIKSDEDKWNTSFVGIQGCNCNHFNALPVGYRNAAGEFVGHKATGCFWTPDENDEHSAYRYFTHIYSGKLFQEIGMKEEAYSVRLVRRVKRQ